MPGTTSPDNLVFPVVGDTASPRTAITQLANSTQTALTSIRTSTDRVVNFFGPSGSIGVVTPKDGDTYQESDGNKILWKRVGGVWVTNESGLYLIRPTNPTVSGSGATVSVDTTGQVNFSSVPSSGRIILDNIFSTRFNDYTIVMRYKFVTDGGFSILLRGGGADRATSNYRYAIMRTDGASSSGTSNGNIPMGSATGSHFYTQIDIHDPMVVEATNYQIRTSRSTAAGAHATEFNSGLYAVSGLDDGIVFIHTAGTGAVTGTIKVYGRP